MDGNAGSRNMNTAKKKKEPQTKELIEMDGGGY